MPKVEKNEDREYRIDMEIIVDAYDEEERAMGWYYYLEDKLRFPSRARCIAERRISPLKVGEEVQALGMILEDACLHEMFVELCWSGRTFGVPLSQLEAIEADSETQEAIEDWHYWVARGYRF
ncbi:MAG: calcium-binding protein [Anaerolineae bacterium]|nr:calcium-binding protein [Anaerolineae bacterium]